MNETFIGWVLVLALLALVLVFVSTFLPWAKRYENSEDEKREDDAALDSVKGELDAWDKAYARRRVRAGTDDAPPSSS